jgi:hypothetical protein
MVESKEKKIHTSLTIDKLQGSLLRCLLMTYFSPRSETARFLTSLAKPSGAVVSAATDVWMPRSLMEWKEATLIDENDFLDNEKRNALREWWLAVPRGANKPNWDIASTCTIDGKKGLLLVEAKAHSMELINAEAAKSEPDNSDHSKMNYDHIDEAIKQANKGLNNISKGWALSRDTHYQLCNRIAWSWKLASLGIPTILIYLGFLNAAEMQSKQSQPFDDANTWEKSILNHAKGIVPNDAWDKRLEIAGTPVWFLIRSLELTFNQR